MDTTLAIIGTGILGIIGVAGVLVSGWFIMLGLDFIVWFFGGGIKNKK